MLSIQHENKISSFQTAIQCSIQCTKNIKTDLREQTSSLKQRYESYMDTSPSFFFMFLLPSALFLIMIHDLIKMSIR